jgi:membrane protease YdiL (CAAX protease family)
MSARRLAVRHPLATFLLVCLAINWAVVLPPLRAWLDVLPLGLQGYESLGTILGVAGAAFLVTAIADGRDGARDLASRSVRWRVGLGWYLLALLGMPAAVLAAAMGMYGWAPARTLADHWPSQLTHTLPLLAMLILLFNLPEEIGWTGFVQAGLQQRHGPLKASALTAFPFALFHMPVNVVEEGWVAALAFLPVQTVLFVLVRTLIIWFYNSTGSSVLIAGLFHASFNSTVNTFGEYIPGPPGTAVLIGTGVATLAAVLIIVLSRGRLGFHPEPWRPPGGSRGSRRQEGQS